MTANTPSPDDLIADLTDKASAKRRKAAKLIGARNLAEAGKALYEALQKEEADPRTWETQGELIRSLGLVAYKPAAPHLLSIVKRNPDHDMVTILAATAYCRLERQSLADASPVIALLQFAGFSVATGAFLALGCDRMVPDDTAIATIIGYARQFDYVKGYGDPRYGVAVAAAGWPPAATKSFLEECLSSKDSGVVDAATSSLKKKYLKCR